MSHDPELEAFKHIDLRAYVVSQGWELDRQEKLGQLSGFSRRPRETRRSSNATATAIGFITPTTKFLTRISASAARAGGTIIDFVQVRKGYNLGQVKQELRPWIGPTGNLHPALPCPAPVLLLTGSGQRGKSLCADGGRGAASLPEDVRRSPADILASRRFPATSGSTARQRGFPALRYRGLWDYEIKNSTFTGFAKGGPKRSMDEPRT